MNEWTNRQEDYLYHQPTKWEQYEIDKNESIILISVEESATHHTCRMFACQCISEYSSYTYSNTVTIAVLCCGESVFTSKIEIQSIINWWCSISNLFEIWILKVHPFKIRKKCVQLSFLDRYVVVVYTIHVCMIRVYSIEVNESWSRLK